MDPAEGVVAIPVDNGEETEVAERQEDDYDSVNFGANGENQDEGELVF